ncbi:MAG TPA: AAA family ATPase [Candidatus Thermoplasmatota archaeon]|nr:AAA family ATPase [Candidatus Thermoplasmatota archaeon]
MPGASVEFDQAITRFDRGSLSEELKRAEEERHAFTLAYPLEAWNDLSLEQYALGQGGKGKPTVSYLLEFGTQHLGSIGGGDSRKHVIYRRKEDQSWYFPSRFSSVDEAWASLRASFLEAFEAAKRGDWQKIDQLDPLYNAPMVRQKTLHIYFPDEILPIYSRDHLVHFLRALGVTDTDSDYKDYNVVRLNRRLLHTIRETGLVQGWSHVEIMRFLYSWNDPRSTRRVVKIAPGENAKYWSDCLAGDYICVGWDQVGDLRQYANKAAFRDEFREKTDYESKSKATEKANEVWTLMELQPGDIVIANQGTSKVLAVGTVTEEGYLWRPERPEYKHTVGVKWDTSRARTIPPQPRWALVTVAKVSPELYNVIMGEDTEGEPSPAIEAADPIFEEMAQTLERKGQLILYGPPGTGKTYHARRFAEWWLKEKHRTPAEARAAGETPSRYWWIVANPKQWSWDQLFDEQTVEYRYGRLKRNYPLVQPGDLVFGYQSTPDKRLMAIARVTRGLHTKPNSQEPVIELAPVMRLTNGITYDEILEDPLLGESEPARFNNQGTLFGLTAEQAHRILDRLATTQPEVLDEVEPEPGAPNLTQLTFHPSYSYEDFIEGFRPGIDRKGTPTLKLEDGVFKRVCREAHGRPDERFLILIDEINRAHVSKVFGELITLIEKDKRGITTTLPQSKEPFSIPPNVYIMGTMNTSDRSIKLLDAALRRRFAFREMMPDPSTLAGAKIQGLELDAFLRKLNARIAENLGREKQIGHSYFLENGEPITSSDEFACRFREDVLPLLQEYCYDDYPALARFLGNALVQPKLQRLDEELLQDDDRLVAALVEEYARDDTDESE